MSTSTRFRAPGGGWSPEEKNGQPVVLTPNPFYQVYAVAALSVGAEPVYVPATAETGHLPDFNALPEDVLRRTALAYICSPANPQGNCRISGCGPGKANV